MSVYCTRYFRFLAFIKRDTPVADWKNNRELRRFVIAKSNGRLTFPMRGQYCVSVIELSNENASRRRLFPGPEDERIRFRGCEHAGDGRVMAGRETFGCNSSAAFRGFMAPIWIPGASAAI